MGENDLQNQIVQVLATVLGAQKQEELEQALQMMDEEGRNQLIQFVASAVQQGQVDDNTLAQAQQLAKQALQKGKARKAGFGAKLEYIKKLQDGGKPKPKPNIHRKKVTYKDKKGKDLVTIRQEVRKPDMIGTRPAVTKVTDIEMPGFPTINKFMPKTPIKTSKDIYGGLYYGPEDNFDYPSFDMGSADRKVKVVPDAAPGLLKSPFALDVAKAVTFVPRTITNGLTKLGANAVLTGIKAGKYFGLIPSDKKGGTLIPKHQAGAASLYYNPNGPETKEVIEGKKRNRLPRIERYSNNDDNNPQEKFTFVTSTKSYPLFEGNGFLNNIWKKPFSQAFTNMFNSVPLEARKTMDLYDFPNSNKTNPYKVYNKK